MNGRRVFHGRGKVLGGSSSINGMIFIRGNPMDYAKWARDPGLEKWDYAHCLPYFKRSEERLAGGDDYHGTEGPLKLERGPCTNPLFGAFFDAAVQAGYPRTDDVNGYQQEGFGPFDRNVYRGRRLSAARAYLHPVKKRPNLDVICRAMSTRIDFEGNRAVSVRYTRGGAKKSIGSGPMRSFRAAGPSIRRSCCNSREWELRTTSRVLASMWFTTCPGSGRICRTIWRCISSMPAPNRSRCIRRCNGGTNLLWAINGSFIARVLRLPITLRPGDSSGAMRMWNTRISSFISCPLRSVTTGHRPVGATGIRFTWGP